MTQLSIPCTAQGQAIPHRIPATDPNAFICFRRRARKASRSSSSSAPAPSLSSHDNARHMGHGWTWGVLENDGLQTTCHPQLWPLALRTLSWGWPRSSSSLDFISPLASTSTISSSHGELSTPQCRCTTDEEPHTVQAQDSLSEPR